MTMETKQVTWETLAKSLAEYATTADMLAGQFRHVAAGEDKPGEAERDELLASMRTFIRASNNLTVAAIGLRKSVCPQVEEEQLCTTPTQSARP